MRGFICIILVFLLFQGHAQNMTKQNRPYMMQVQDSMKQSSGQLLQGINFSDRYQADSLFTRQLVRALRIKHSFDFSFDSLLSISRLYAPDSSFRIFTWQLVVNENTIRQHGAIQMRTADGTLQLYPLIDRSDVTDAPADTIANHLGWMGAIYYKIILNTYQGRSYYTLLGFDENNIRSDKKIIEVLHFDQNGPVFGNRCFEMDSKGSDNKRARYIMEFKKQSGPRLTYDEQLQMIVMEHLISETNEPNKKWTMIGDGDYEGFKWINGKWVYTEKIFNQMIPEGQAPVPNKILDEKGKVDESKLKEIPKD